MNHRNRLVRPTLVVAAIVAQFTCFAAGFDIRSAHAAQASAPRAAAGSTDPGKRIPDFAKMHLVGPEGTVFRLAKPVHGYYVAVPPGSADPKWVEGDLPAGIHSATNGLWGDPLGGVVKKLYVVDASALIAMPGPLPEPGPPPAGFTVTRAMLEPLKLHPGWPRETIGNAVLASLTTRETPLTPGEMTRDEFGTGYRPEIGAVAYASQLYLTTLDPRARLHMLAQADLSRVSFPVHRNLAGRTSDTAPEPWLYGDRTDLVDDPLKAAQIKVDIAHAPQFLTVPAFLMGLEGNEAKFREYLGELRWWVSTVHFSMQPNYRQGAKGIFNSYMGQVRATAWAFRNVDDLLLLHEQMASFGFRMTELDTAWMRWLAACVDANVRFNDGVFRRGDYPTDIPQGRPGSFEPYAGRPKGIYRNELGFTVGGTSAYGGGHDGKDVVQGMWQQGFQTHMLIRSYRRDHRTLSAETKAMFARLAQWLARFPVGLCGAEGDPAGYDIRYADMYTMVIGRTGNDGRPIFPTDFAQLFALQRFAPLPPPDHSMRHDGDPASVSYFRGSFFDDVFPALSEAVEIGAPGAKEAYDRLERIRQFRDPGPDLAFAWTPKAKTLGGGAASPAKATGLPPAPTPVGAASAPVSALVREHAAADQPPPFDVARATRLGDENAQAALAVAAWVWYGADGHFVPRHFPAGIVTLTNDAFGADPAPGVVKAGYVMDVAAIKPTPTAAGADLLKGEPAGRGSGYFPGTELLPDPAMPTPTWGSPMPLLTRRARIVPPGFVKSPPNGPRAQPRPIRPGSPIVTFPDTAMRRTLPDLRAGFFDVWAGGAFDWSARKAWFRPAGGHGGGNEVTVVETDLDSFATRRSFPDVPTPLVVDAAHDDRAPLPPFAQSAHNYGTEVSLLDPLTGRRAFFSMGTTPDPVLFDPTGDGHYEVLQRLNDNTTGAVAIADDRTASVWLQVTGPTNRLYRWDLRSRRLFAHGASATPESWKGGPAGLTDDQVLWFIVPGTDPANGGAVVTDHAWIAQLPVARIVEHAAEPRTFVRIDHWNIPGSFAAAYDRIGRRWIVHAVDPANPRQGRWWSLSRDTLKVTDIAAGGPVPASNGTNGRFAIDEQRDCVVTVADSTTDFYGLKIPR